MKIIERDINTLIPYTNNARTHTNYQVGLIAKSIKEMGFNNPVLIDPKNNIIAGHGRVMAAKMLGMRQVPCVELPHLTPTQQRAYILADNQLALLADWDVELLNIELDALEADGFDMTIFGEDFSLDLEEPEIDKIEDVSPELPGAMALKNEMVFPSRLPWNMPELRSDMLSNIPPRLTTWAGRDATPDDESSWYMWNWRTDSLRGVPRDRLMIGFYTEDHRFEPVWQEPAKYVAQMLNLGVRVALTPNFSLWYDQPEACHLWATYKSRWIGRYMQEAGIAIIPDIQISHRGNFEYCLLGIPVGAPALSVQFQTFNADKEMHMLVDLYNHALDQLKPKTLLAYGGRQTRSICEKLSFDGEIVYIPSRADLRRDIMDRKV